MVLAVLVRLYRQGEPKIQTFPPAFTATGCMGDVCAALFTPQLV